MMMAKGGKGGGRKGKAKGRYPGVKKSQFGIPGKRAYPLNTKRRAGNAKARAKQALKRRRISKATYSRIVAKANLKLYGKRKAPKGRA
jgi:hypothetical protein